MSAGGNHDNGAPDNRSGTFRFFGARVTGQSHVEKGLGCDDAFSFADAGEWFAAVVCDGAGSASRSAEGAQLISERVVALLCEALPGRDPAVPVRRLVAEVISKAREELQTLAEESDGLLSHYHTTVVGCTGRKGRMILFHIGDGAGVGFAKDTDEGRLVPVAASPPVNGEYANETYFVTEESWRNTLRFTPMLGAQWVALISDGVTDFALDRAQTGPATAFFQPLLGFLETAQSTVAEKALERMLDREDARKVSTDDKTMVFVRSPGGAGDGV